MTSHCETFCDYARPCELALPGPNTARDYTELRTINGSFSTPTRFTR